MSDTKYSNLMSGGWSYRGGGSNNSGENTPTVDLTNVVKNLNQVVEDTNDFVTTGYAKTAQNNTANLPTEVVGTVGEWGVLQCVIENPDYGTGTQMFYPVNGDYAGRVFTRHILDMNTDDPKPGDWTLLTTLGDLTAGNGISITGTGNDVVIAVDLEQWEGGNY